MTRIIYREGTKLSTNDLYEQSELRVPLRTDAKPYEERILQMILTVTRRPQMSNSWVSSFVDETQEAKKN